MEKIFVDTSGWVALWIENDHNHKIAVSIFENMKRSKMSIYTSDYVIDETITTILGRVGHKQSILAGEALLNSGVVKVVFVAPDYFESTWELYRKYKDKRFSFTDVSSFSVMKELKLHKAFSFDTDFAQVGIELLGEN